MSDTTADHNGRHAALDRALAKYPRFLKTHEESVAFGYGFGEGWNAAVEAAELVEALTEARFYVAAAMGGREAPPPPRVLALIDAALAKWKERNP